MLSIFAYNQYSLVLKIYDVGFGDKVARRSVIMSASDSWLFEEYQKFSALEFIDLDKDNAIELKKSMEKLLHFSAEPRVIRPLLSVLWNLQDVDEFNFHISRFCIVFPSAFLKWKKENDSTPMGLYIDEQINMELVCGK